LRRSPLRKDPVNIEKRDRRLRGCWKGEMSIVVEIGKGLVERL
jgi:hypothetical protein